MFVIANWKMNGNQALVEAFAAAFADHSSLFDTVNVAVCPPAVLLPSWQESAENSALILGGQDVNEHLSGAHTGEHSLDLLASAGAELVLLGHSERRQFYADSDARVAAKLATVMAAVEAGEAWQAVLCVGESATQRQQEQTFTVIAAQLESAFASLSEAQLALVKDALIVAYEPVWAIGTGLTATPEQAQQVHKFIREWLAQKFDASTATLPLLYGGSVKPENADELFAQQDIDGGLIGGASLDAKAFIAICQAAENRSK